MVNTYVLNSPIVLALSDIMLIDEKGSQ